MAQDDAMYVYNIFSHIMGPSALFATIVTGVAVISNYWYPQQRKFPNIVLIWSRYAHDVFLSLLIIILVLWICGWPCMLL